MNKTYEVYLISDSTGETLDRIFLALQAQFLNFNINHHINMHLREQKIK